MRKMWVSSVVLTLVICLSIFSPLSAQEKNDECVPCQDLDNVIFDSTLIASLPIDLQSVEKTLLSEVDHKMIGQKGDEVYFIVYDNRLPSGKSAFSFNVKTFALTLENASKPVDQAQIMFANATSSAQQLIHKVGFWGCYYRHQGPIRCIGHTMYGYFCLTGSWYCSIIGSCRWIPIGSC